MAKQNLPPVERKILPQTIPDTVFPADLPEHKKTLWKKVFSTNSDEEVMNIILSDPEYLAAKTKNEIAEKNQKPFSIDPNNPNMSLI